MTSPTFTQEQIQAYLRSLSDEDFLRLCYERGVKLTKEQLRQAQAGGKDTPLQRRMGDTFREIAFIENLDGLSFADLQWLSDRPGISTEIRKRIDSPRRKAQCGRFVGVSLLWIDRPSCAAPFRPCGNSRPATAAAPASVADGRLPRLWEILCDP